MPLLETKGAGSAQGFGLSLGSAERVYIEDVFSTYLYTGTGATHTITNGIDLDGEGGLVWGKHREFAVDHAWYDTERGINQRIGSSTTQAETTIANTITSFNSDGVTLGTGNSLNESGRKIALWTFRKQPKFFDVVTYTGTGSARTIAHNLGSVPGCIIVKKTSGADNWFVQHRSLGATKYIALNDVDIAYTNSQIWNNTEPTSTVFTLGTNSGVNQSGATYVAYLFAHDAGGFGLTGLDNVISCGTFTTSSGGATVNLGYEAQWVLVKATGVSESWYLLDNMRNMSFSEPGGYLSPNNSNAEPTFGSPMATATSTGFIITNGQLSSSANYIYIAIRRGPMEVPTSGTSVFQPLTRNGTGGATTVTSTVRPDTVLQNWRSGGLGASNHFMYDRLRGVAKALFTDTADAESTQTATGINAFNNLSYGIAGAGSMNNGSALYADYVFTRAPGFFDEVCYTGNDTARTLTHNLAAVPELMIVKSRSGTANWSVYVAATTATNVMRLNNANASFGASGYWNNTAPTASVFTIGNNGDVNSTGTTYVAYLFATCAGVSKVGSYTGTGTTLQINCGFTGGARFVMIKRTDNTGDWYVWDSARGIVAGNDPYLLLNSTAAEVTNTDYVDTYSLGFEISSTAPAAINANGGTFIFLAIA